MIADVSSRRLQPAPDERLAAHLQVRRSRPPVCHRARDYAVAAIALALVLAAPNLTGVEAKKLEPLVYTIRFPEPASKTFNVEIIVPTDKRESVDLMMAIWSPGFYGIQNYADRVSGFTAKAPDGTVLDVEKPKPSRWTIRTGGRPSITVTYTLAAPRGSNLSNGVTETSAVIATTEEIDYHEMLDWFGLRFDPAREWTLEVRPDATAEQQAHFAAFLSHSKAR